MNENDLHKIASDYLLPFFSGAELQPASVPSTPQETCVAWIDPCTIGFKIDRADGYRLYLRRSQPFATESGDHLSEKSVVEAFVEVVRSIEAGLDQPYRLDLLSSLQRRVVVRSLAQAPFDGFLLGCLDQMVSWSSRLYEGHPITSAIGFVPDDSIQTVTLRDTWKFDFSAVLTNGHDTLLSVNHTGNVVSHESLAFPNRVPSFAPYRLAPLADWARNGRIALALNRTGELLILKDQKLLFARRSGAWHFLTPDAVVTQLGRPDDINIRTAVLETALDVSFARTGGCIGIVISTHQNKWKKIVVSTDDHLSASSSIKSKIVNLAIAGRRFQDLDRRLRQELVSVDGATVINHHGEILAVGAILKIPGGSTGGGRTAAAKALSKYGLGIKISQDGKMQCYRDGADEPKVSLM